MLRVGEERLGERERTREVGVQVQPMRTWCWGSGEELCDGFQVQVVAKNYVLAVPIEKNRNLTTPDQKFQED